MARIWNIDAPVTQEATFSASVAGLLEGLFLNRRFLVPLWSVVTLCLISRVRSVRGDCPFPSVLYGRQLLLWVCLVIRDLSMLKVSIVIDFSKIMRIFMKRAILFPVRLLFLCLFECLVVGFYFFILAQEEALCNSTIQSSPLFFLFLFFIQC